MTKTGIFHGPQIRQEPAVPENLVDVREGTGGTISPRRQYNGREVSRQMEYPYDG